jgi:hypothetical protein
MWTAYLIIVHLWGLYWFAALLLPLWLESATNVLTGETKPWARGIGWTVVGAVIVGAAWLIVGRCA